MTFFRSMAVLVAGALVSLTALGLTLIQNTGPAWPLLAALVSVLIVTIQSLMLLRNVRTLGAELQYMSEEHALGDIDVVLDTSRFGGSFKALAHGINELVAAHIIVKKKAMACIKAFGEGDLTAPL